MKNALIIALVFILTVALSITIVTALENTRSQRMDDVAKLNHAIIFLHNGEMIEGNLENWGMINDNVIQVVIDGHTYRTHYSNVVLSDEGD